MRRHLLAISLLVLLSYCPANAKEGRGSRRSLQVAEVRCSCRCILRWPGPTGKTLSRPHTTLPTQPSSYRYIPPYDIFTNPLASPATQGLLSQGCLGGHNGPLHNAHYRYCTLHNAHYRHPPDRPFPPSPQVGGTVFSHVSTPCNASATTTGTVAGCYDKHVKTAGNTDYKMTDPEVQNPLPIFILLAWSIISYVWSSDLNSAASLTVS